MNPIATITGTVQHNIGRGKEMGYPTINLSYDGELEDGVYLSYTKIEERKLPSLAFIGTAVTFNETKRQLEVYIMDFNEDLYDKKVTVELLKFTRKTIKFDSIEALITQIKQDEVDARIYFKLPSKQ